MFSEKSSRIKAPGNSDLAADVTKTNAKPKPLIDCLTSNAVRCGFSTCLIHHNEAQIELPCPDGKTGGHLQTS